MKFAYSTSNHKTIPSENGSITFLALGFATVLALTCLGLLHLQRTWQKRVKEQLRLDHCVYRVTKRIANDLNQIAHLNQRKALTRKAILTAIALGQGELVVTLKKGLIVLDSLQRGFITKVKITRMRWNLRLQCGSLFDSPQPLANFPYQPLPPDPLGPRPLRGPTPKTWSVKISRDPVRSASKIEYAPTAGHWRKRWIPYARKPKVNSVKL